MIRGLSMKRCTGNGKSNNEYKKDRKRSNVRNVVIRLIAP